MTRFGDLAIGQRFTTPGDGWQYVKVRHYTDYDAFLRSDRTYNAINTGPLSPGPAYFSDLTPVTPQSRIKGST